MRELKSIERIQKAVLLMIRPCANGGLICDTCADIPCGLIDNCSCECHDVTEMLEVAAKMANKFLECELKRI